MYTLYISPLHLISSHRREKYNIPLAAKATSKPMSPLFFAIGPVNQTWLMHGITIPKHATPAVRAASPVGRRRGIFHARRS